ncbi:MAG TPA: hypothetical protein DIW27_07790 [Cytophagales bacterium]|nr:hypothetical protein [Cytophagales bacterium]
MSTNLTKMQWVEKFVKGDLFSFLMKNNIIKKGDSICYAKITGITMEDFHMYCSKNGYPGLDIPRHQIRTSPLGEEGQTEWTLENNVYKVWFSERNTSYLVYETTSQLEFRTYWLKEMEQVWSYRLNREWIL